MEEKIRSDTSRRLAILIFDNFEETPWPNMVNSILRNEHVQPALSCKLTQWDIFFPLPLFLLLLVLPFPFFPRIHVSISLVISISTSIRIRIRIRIYIYIRIFISLHLPIRIQPLFNLIATLEHLKQLDRIHEIALPATPQVLPVVRSPRRQARKASDKHRLQLHQVMLHARPLEERGELAVLEPAAHAHV